MALVRIPFTYTCVGVLKRHRDVEPWIFGGFTDIEIPEITSDDAPVSMTWRPFDFHTADHVLQPAVRTARWHDGRNWLPADQGSLHHDPVPFLPEDFGRLGRLEHEKINRRYGFSHLDFLAKAIGQDYHDLRAFLLREGVPAATGGEFRELLYDGRAEAEDKVRQRCRDLLFIDGCLWHAGSEPRYRVPFSPLKARHEPDALHVDITATTGPGRWDTPDSVAFFRADRPDDAADYCREMMAGQDRNVVVRTERIEVLIPEAVTFDDEADAQLRAGAHAVKEAVPSLPHAPVEALLAWAALRDGLAGGDASAEEVRSLLDAVAAAFPHNQGVARAAEAARRRWNLRPLNVFSVKP